LFPKNRIGLSQFFSNLPNRLMSTFDNYFFCKV
jgi:hypothetical protein